MTEPSDDDLRARLARVDPAPVGVPVAPVTSARAREMLHRAMRTPGRASPTPPATDDLGARSHRRRPLLMAAVAAAVLAALVGGALALTRSAGPGATGDPRSTLALSLPPSDVAASCLAFDVQHLAEMPVALAGTVTAVDVGKVTLDVDRWYRGGSADVVTIAVPHDTSAALDGVDFRPGERYLVAATGGTVNGCGFSGPATRELERAYADAFGS